MTIYSNAINPFTCSHGEWCNLRLSSWLISPDDGDNRWDNYIGGGDDGEDNNANNNPHCQEELNKGKLNQIFDQEMDIAREHVESISMNSVANLVADPVNQGQN